MASCHGLRLLDTNFPAFLVQDSFPNPDSPQLASL